MLKTLATILSVAGLAAVGVTIAESYGHSTQIGNLAHGLWWAMVTMTTVGYGDMVPVTNAGRLIAVVVMMAGIALVSIFTAAVSSSVITRRLKEGKGLSGIIDKGHIGILGWNSRAEDIIAVVEDEAIRHDRSLVLINRHSADEMESIKTKYHQLRLKFVFGDPTDEEVLRRASMDAAYAAIIIPDSENAGDNRPDEKTMLAALTMKSLNSKAIVVAHILDPANESHLRKANADHVVVDSKYSGYLVGAHVTSPGVPETFDMLLRGQQGIQIQRRSVPAAFVGKTFAELSSHFKSNQDCILLGFIKESQVSLLKDVLSDDYSSIDLFIKSELEAAGKGSLTSPRLDVNLNPPAEYVIQKNEVALVLDRV